MVKSPLSNSGSVGSIPGQRIEILNDSKVEKPEEMHELCTELLSTVE